MAAGKFKLFYKNGNDEHACGAVRYRVESSGSAVLVDGVTGPDGETKRFASSTDGDQCTLKVHDAATGDWTKPDIYDEPDSACDVKLGAVADNGVTLQRVRVKPYFDVRFLTHPDRKPLPGASFTAYALNASGKEAVAKDLVRSNNVTGITDAKGETGIVYCASNVVFKFEVPGTPVKVSSKRLTPMVKGQDTALYEVPLKTVRSTTGPAVGHQAQLSGKTSAPFLISPQDDELIMVPQRDYDEFEEMSGRLEKIMEASHLAKLDLSRALDAQSAADISAAEKALKLAESKVKSELNKNFPKLADLKEVMTLESYRKGKSSATGAAEFGLRRRYLKADKYLELKNKRINKTEFKITIKNNKYLGAAKETKTIKPESLDVAALKESIGKIKTSVKSNKEWKPDAKVLNLFDMAAHEYSDSLVKSRTYEVDGNSQWLRLVVGAGASSEIDWSKRTAQIQGNLQGKFVLCEGKVTGRWATPSLKGWMMTFGGEDLGAIRFVIECDFYGFAGAKVTATGTVGITLESGKQVAKAIRQGDGDSFAKAFDPKTRLPRFDPAGAYEKAPEDLNGVKAEIDAFAGVEAGITPGGKIQWLPPQQKEFVAFAEIAGTLAGNAGAGAGAQLTIYLADGKFRVKASARLCWGLGCKGALEFTVSANKVMEFAKWVAYQLLNAGFTKLVYFERIAFDALSRLLLICVTQGSPTPIEIERLTKAVDDEFDEALMQFAQAKGRQAMVDNINRPQDWLKFATPETRGMLLYQITRHSKASHGRDMPSVNLSEGTWTDTEVHFLPDHKQAVCNILATVQTASCWDNVMQHMSEKGAKTAQQSGRNEGDVLRFLNNGISLANLPSVLERLNETGPVIHASSKEKSSGNKYLDQYLTMRGKLIDKFPKGYCIARTDSLEFEMYASLDGERHIEFGEIQTAELGEVMSGDRGSSLA